MIILTSNKMQHICKKCDMALSENEYDDHICPPKESEYCPHGIRHFRNCKSCECIEQAEMRGEL